MAENNIQLKKRPPVVVVLGHVDHGKTSLLDYIRKSRVAEREAGGITQSVGAYEIVHNNGEKITFIDTPGHEAFKAMRQRGAQFADIAVLVVAADDGPKPQTEESVRILEESNTPYVVAITKSDSPRADVDKVKNELMSINVFLEGYGGDISWQAVSSKTGEGVSELLDLILLLAEVSDFKYDESAPARGYVLECRKDSRKGNLISLVLKNGKIKQGDEIKTVSVSGKIKILEDFTGKTVKELVPSAPAVVIGFENLPNVGEEFVSGSGEIEVIQRPKVEKQSKPKEGEVIIPVILKADTSGSLEVLKDVLADITKVIDASAGDITDGDVKSAAASNAYIVSYRTKFNSKMVENFAKAQSVSVFSSEIIYELIETIEKYIESISAPKLDGKMEVLATFGKKDDKQIIGGKVLEGDIKLGKKIEIRRRGILVGDGKIVNLQMNKMDAKEVPAGNECGLLVDSLATIKIGDELSQATIK